MPLGIKETGEGYAKWVQFNKEHNIAMDLTGNQRKVVMILLANKEELNLIGGFSKICKSVFRYLRENR